MYVYTVSVELPEPGFSPQATRRISSGSLLKASEVVSLAATTARLGGSSISLRNERAKSVDKTEDVKKLPIINPLVRLPMWPSKLKQDYVFNIYFLLCYIIVDTCRCQWWSWSYQSSIVSKCRCSLCSSITINGSGRDTDVCYAYYRTGC